MNIAIPALAVCHRDEGGSWSSSRAGPVDFLDANGTSNAVGRVPGHAPAALLGGHDVTRLTCFSFEDQLKRRKEERGCVGRQTEVVQKLSHSLSRLMIHRWFTV